MSLAYLHIPPNAMKEAIAEKYGAGGPPIIPDKDGDFGCIYNPWYSGMDTDNTFFNMVGAVGTKGMLFGHMHKESGSILYKNVRLTYVLKTGVDAISPDAAEAIGGTVTTINLNDGTFKAEHIYQERYE